MSDKPGTELLIGSKDISLISNSSTTLQWLDSFPAMKLHPAPGSPDISLNTSNYQNDIPRSHSL